MKIRRLLNNNFLQATNLPAGRQGYKLQARNGFTLVELLIVLGIMVIVAALAVPFFQTFQVSADSNTYANTVVQLMRRAEQQAIDGQNLSSWGVYFDNNSKKVILFKGTSYASRDESYDQSTDYPAAFSLSTDFGSEIIFSLYSGKPAVAGTVTVTNANNQSKNITISSLGLIQIND